MAQLALELEALRLPMDPWAKIPDGETYWCVIGLSHPEPCDHGEMGECPNEAKFRIGRFTKSKKGGLFSMWAWDECEKHAKARAKKHGLTLPAPGEKWERWPEVAA